VNVSHLLILFSLEFISSSEQRFRFTSTKFDIRSIDLSFSGENRARFDFSIRLAIAGFNNALKWVDIFCGGL